MYKIEKEDFGFQLTFADPISIDEITHWRFEAVRALVGVRESFGVIFDLRKLAPGELAPEVQEAISEGRDLFMRSGMRRSCVILESATVTAQYRRYARESRKRSYERYINASVDPFWRKRAIAWLEQSVDPGI